MLPLAAAPFRRRRHRERDAPTPRYNLRTNACMNQLSQTALLLLIFSVGVQGRLSSTLSPLSSSAKSGKVLSDSTILTDEHIQSILSFNPTNPPQRNDDRHLQEVTAADEAICEPLKIDEWISILSSETAADFDLTQEVVDEAARRGADPSLLLARAQIMWQDVSDFEWERAYRATTIRGKPSPFVVCLKKPARHDRSSGNKRKRIIRNKIREAISEVGDEVTWRKVILKTLYNADDMFCTYTLMDAIVAQKLDFDGCVVQPMHMTMKLMPRTVQLLAEKAEECQAEIDNDGRFNRRDEELIDVRSRSNDSRESKMIEDETNGRRDQQSVLDLLLGDGDQDDTSRFNGDENAEQQQDGQEPDDNRLFDNLPDCDAFDLVRPAADILFCPGSLHYNQVQAIQQGDPSYIVAALTSTIGASNKPSIPEEVYWTSDLAEKFRRGLETVRAQYWRDALAQAGSERCQYFYWKKLNFTVQPGDDDDEMAVLRVVYNAPTADKDDLSCAASLVAGLAVRQDVCALELVADTSVDGYTSNWMVQSGVPDERPFTDLGLDGEGQIVAFSDTGIDINNCYFYDKNAEPSEDLDTNAHRKIAMYRPYADKEDHELGHGTHVGAIIAGNRSPDGRSDEPGFADGIAPAAKLAFIDISKSFTAGQARLDPPEDHKELLSTGRATRDNSSPIAHIHSLSWGNDNEIWYGNANRAFDNFMYFNDDFLAVVSAGNEGKFDKESSISSPASAKNVLSVGASHSFGSNLEQRQLGPTYVADFSSRGPTQGRIAPDVVAPGKYVISAAARPNRPGSCDSSDRAAPGPGEDSEGLFSQAGTSMAAPVVAGSAAIIRQYFEEGWYGTGSKLSDISFKPSGALVKAVLMNGAQPDMQGVDNGDRGVTPVQPYDNAQGFGRVSLSDSLYVRGKTEVQLKFWDRETLYDGDAAKTFEVEIDKSGGCEASLSVTLTWMEPASSPGCTKCLLNDLDLSLVEAGREAVRFHPNGRSVKDHENNVERVVIDDVPDGSRFLIHVEAYNLNDISQAFALVATGCFGGVTSSDLDTSQNVFSKDLSVVRKENGGEGMDMTTIIIVVCASCAGAILLCVGYGCLRRRGQKKKQKKRRKKMEYPSPPKPITRKTTG